MINNQLVNSCLIGTTLLSLGLFLFPQLDISVSSTFYDARGRFIPKEESYYLIYQLIPLVTKIFSYGCGAYLLYLLGKHRNLKKVVQSYVFFLFITAAIGPGIVVNFGLKENFGRARPYQITEFSGDSKFTKAFIISDQCSTNCSFPSGHAAMGYYFTSIAYLVGRSYFSLFYIIGIIFGTGVGVTRIIVGAHFASDVIAACLLILLINHIIYLLWKKIK
jgi:lipid A 4'-phosphatase